MNEQELRQYLKEHLYIEVQEIDYGFNGKELVINLLLDDEVISYGTFTLSHDEG